MAPHEMVHRLIPGSPVSPNTGTVPPLSVKFSVAKSHDFSERVEDRLKDREEASKPYHERYCR